MKYVDLGREGQCQASIVPGGRVAKIFRSWEGGRVTYQQASPGREVE